MEGILAGHYRIIRPLGSGGFAETFLAVDEHLPGKPACVVKQLKLAVRDPDALQTAKRLFNLEAKTLYRLGNHDQIPRLLAHFEQDGEFFLVQEFVDGLALNQEWLNTLPLSEQDVLLLLQDVLQVLVFVHQQGVIHRDIKPSNLIRRRSDRKMVLIDFGAVKQVSNPNASDATLAANYTIAIGSPGYMPIEQQLNQPRFSSDIYALGILALQALTGIPPTRFPRDEQTHGVACVLFDSALSIDPALATILDRMVCEDHRQRYPNASAALQALSPRLANLGLEVTQTPFPAIAVSVNPMGDADTLQGSADTNLTLSPTDAGTQNQADVRRASEITATIPPDLAPISPAPAVSEPHASGNAVSTNVLPLAPFSSAISLGDAQLNSRELRNRQALLNKVNHYWIKGVLDTSLHDQVLMTLGMEARSQAVASPWNVAVEMEQSPIDALPKGTPIIAVWDQLGTGRTLLILGEPGAGKTNALLQLTRDLLQRAEQDISHLIPVVLNLSSWSGEHQTIANWVIQELSIKYQVPKQIGQPWVENQQLLLLLDGLDEVRPQHRSACVTALNQFQQTYSAEMVVCSRIKDYEALSTRLTFQSAVYLRSLTASQIDDYLNHLSGDLTGLRSLLAEDASLQELAQSPLILNIMVLAYQGLTARGLPRTNTVEECRQQLFDAYLDRMLKRRGTKNHYSETQTIRWLSWLAQELRHTSQTIFLIERIDRSWLQTPPQRWAYILLASLIVSLVLGWLTALSSGFKNWLTVELIVAASYGSVQILLAWLVIRVEQMAASPLKARLQRQVNSLSGGVLTGVLFGLIAGIQIRPDVGLIVGLLLAPFVTMMEWFTGGILTLSYLSPVETLRWSWKNVKAYLLFGILGAGIIGLSLGWAGFLGRSPLHGLILGSLAGFIFGILSGLRASAEIGTRTVPNQGTWRSVKTATIVALSISIGALIAIQLLGHFFPVSPTFGMFFGLFMGLIMGGAATIVHLSLRLVFYGSGCIPWNYARFLDYACDRILLQKVGGGYIFIHRLLMEHLANLTPPK
jgi:serine/threonine protein kinase/GTPase SAR1 family protein